MTTITEALAEIKTIQKRIQKKREFILQYLSRPEDRKDPLEKEGGSFNSISQERQAILDLEKRIVLLRRGIHQVNNSTSVTILGTQRTIADWLVWRREVAPELAEFLATVRNALNRARDNAKRSGGNVVQAGNVSEKQSDIIVNINEQELAKEIENLENTLGQLDGQLSLKNATVQIAL